MNPLVFQFHKGTIRTLSPQKAYHSIGLFQFHKGTIRTHVLNNHHRRNQLFQFHKGTIRTSNQRSETAPYRISIP